MIKVLSFPDKKTKNIVQTFSATLLILLLIAAITAITGGGFAYAQDDIIGGPPETPVERLPTSQPPSPAAA
jgi:hypothetical protein